MAHCFRKSEYQAPGADISDDEVEMTFGCCRKSNYHTTEADTPDQASWTWAEWRRPTIAIILTFICSVQSSMLDVGQWNYLITIDEETTSSFYGTATAVSKAGHAVFAFVFAVWAHKASGIKVPMLVGLCITLISCIMCIFVEFLQVNRRWWMFTCYILFGVGFGTSPLLRSYVARHTSDENRSTAYALQIGAVVLAVIVGPLAQISFAGLPYPGARIVYPHINLNIFTAPIWFAVITNVIGILLVIFALDDSQDESTTVEESESSSLSFASLRERLVSLRSLNLPWILILLVIFEKIVARFDEATMAAVMGPVFTVMYGFSGEKSVLINGITQIIVGALVLALSLIFFACKLGRFVSCRTLFVFSNITIVVGYIISYPFPFSSDPVPAFNETTRLGCSPLEYPWCGYQLVVNIVPSLIIFIVTNAFAIPSAALSLDTIYSKMLGDIDQNVMQSLLVIVEDIISIVGPIVGTAILGSAGLNIMTIINGCVYIFGTIYGMTVCCRKSEYHTPEANIPDEKKWTWEEWKRPIIAVILTFLSNVESSMLAAGEWHYLSTIDHDTTASFYGNASAISVAAHALFAFLFALWAHRISGIKIFLLVGQCITLASCIMCLFVEFIPLNRRWWMLVCYILFGVGVGTSPLLRSYIARNTSEENRSTAYALQTRANVVSVIIGPLAQICFAGLPYPGVRIFYQNLNLNIFTAPIWLAAFTNVLAIVVNLFVLEDSCEAVSDEKDTSCNSYSFGAIRERLASLRELNLPWMLIALIIFEKLVDGLDSATMAAVAGPVMSVMYAYSGEKSVTIMGIAEITVGSLAVALSLIFFLCKLGRYVSCRVLFLFSNTLIIVGYIMTYPYPFSSNPMQLFNETTRTGCNPEEYSWCDRQRAVNIVPFLITLIVTNSFALPSAALSLDTIYSKMIGDIDQNVMQSLYVIVEDIIAIIGPIVGTAIFTSAGLNIMCIINGSVYILGTIVWLAAWRWLEPYN